MHRVIFILLFFSFVSCSQKEAVLEQDYSFIWTDGEVKKLHQSNDTLYELKCYVDRPCQPKPTSHYKILSSKKTGQFVVLQLERLDTMALTIDHYPATRYQVVVLAPRGKELGYLRLAVGLTRKQLDTIRTDIPSLDDKFFNTFFGDTYLQELSALKKITTKYEAIEIIETAKSDKFKVLVEKYSNTETHDMYGVALSAELLNQACIAKGYNPVGAGRAINTLMKR